MRETKEVFIRDKKFIVSQFPATEGLRLLSALFGLAGPSLSQAVRAFQGGKGFLDSDVDVGILGDAIQSLAANIAEDSILNLIKRLLADTRCDDGSEVNQRFDLLFARNYKILFLLIKEIIMFNFGEVFFDSNTAPPPPPK